MLELAERAEIRLRFNNQPMHQLLKFYKTTPDTARGGDVTRFIEDEYRAGWVTLQPDTTGAEMEAFNSLRIAIKERELARVPQLRHETKARLEAALSIPKVLLLREIAGLHVAEVQG